MCGWFRVPVRWRVASSLLVSICWLAVASAQETAAPTEIASAEVTTPPPPATTPPPNPDEDVRTHWPKKWSTEPVQIKWAMHQADPDSKRFPGPMCVEVNGRKEDDSLALQICNCKGNDAADQSTQIFEYDPELDQLSHSPANQIYKLCVDADATHLKFKTCDKTKKSEQWYFDAATDHLRSMNPTPAPEMPPKCFKVDAGKFDFIRKTADAEVTASGDQYACGTNVVLTSCEGTNTNQKFILERMHHLNVVPFTTTSTTTKAQSLVTAEDYEDVMVSEANKRDAVVNQHGKADVGEKLLRKGSAPSRGHDGHVISTPAPLERLGVPEVRLPASSVPSAPPSWGVGEASSIMPPPDPLATASTEFEPSSPMLGSVAKLLGDSALHALGSSSLLANGHTPDGEIPLRWHVMLDADPRLCLAGSLVGDGSAGALKLETCSGDLGQQFNFAGLSGQLQWAAHPQLCLDEGTSVSSLATGVANDTQVFFPIFTTCLHNEAQMRQTFAFDSASGRLVSGSSPNHCLHAGIGSSPADVVDGTGLALLPCNSTMDSRQMFLPVSSGIRRPEAVAPAQSMQRGPYMSSAPAAVGGVRGALSTNSSEQRHSREESFTSHLSAAPRVVGQAPLMRAE